MRFGIVRLLVVLSMVFGSVAVPAIAGTGHSGHSVEVVDLDCLGTSNADDSDKHSPSGGVGHIDHHHCSVGLVSDAPALTRPFSASDLVEAGAVRAWVSSATQPPTQPPAA